MEIIKMEEKKAIKCPLCYGIQNKISIHSKRNIYESVAILNNYPTHCNEEKYCIGNAHIDLFQCVECGYIFNKSFSFDKIKNIYEQDNTYYQQKYFTNRLSQHILKIKDSILKYSKKSDIFLEIAPGQGDLLLALSKEAQICYSIDPSTLSDKYCICDNIIHVKSFFDKNIVYKLKHKINFIIFRHLLEHIDTPLTFLQDVADLLEENGMIYIEVPNANDIFKFRRFIDLYHDHCGYYQKGVIANIMKKLNCELVEEVYYFEEQHMGLFFRKKISNNQKYFYSLYNNSLKHQIFNDIINFNTILKHYNTIALYGGGFSRIAC
ncbi:class I SAM-dependent methyltransferase [Campylobacter jejuni]|uniref:class I SAM-dependent methyltransferase n=1 Tax=Campylobacter jejuni TaxID=197 RepID=UPI00087432B9|nr:class I SAM-dependent methyltransferase [Campylobacter jejuni]EAK6248889.1 class I SAM-dependent methyltransferase [Campylobacter jejuni]OEW92137.1 sugar transferase [Campylobacter jejuni]